MTDELLDDAWLAERPRPRLRVALTIAVVLSATFLGGVLVQKHWGTETSAATSAGLPAGFPQGMAGAGGGPGNFDAPASETDEAETDEVTIVGTVTARDGTTWTVEDLGGRTYTVEVTADVEPVREERITPGEVTEGSTVSLTGTGTRDDLAVTAVVVR